MVALIVTNGKIAHFAGGPVFVMPGTFEQFTLK
jgi:hypothetical protein